MQYLVHKAVDWDKLSKSAKAVCDVVAHWIVSPKYDGCHVIFLFEDGKYLMALSRTGELVESMHHVGRALELHYPMSGSTVRDVAICGEAWMPGMEFSEISGMFRRQSEQPQLGFVPFDIVPYTSSQTDNLAHVLLGHANGKAVGTPYSKRIAALRDKFVPCYSTVIKPLFLELHMPRSEAYDFATRYAKEMKAASVGGYDGAIMAMGSGKYVVGAGTGGEFIKCKPLLSETVTVTTTYPDTGEKTGKNTLALGFTLNGKDQKVSTGLTQAEVDEYVANPHRIIGQRIEVEAMGITTHGLLREPRYKGIRNDA